ncbi:lymphatic vessel endothelial hyaluronic acid receptor 1a [Erpetoichthys calabaricus]|uniref:Link domain-containing protein n=1 Tax=Erpetoichthys calabaricus TaxID=27687 RepID=A0A8C4RU19_ERPCA|nr:lymphatic vessel endothelial hyaluronic acid receptor 1a [Erpetoichthys calabaricus]
MMTAFWTALFFFFPLSFSLMDLSKATGRKITKCRISGVLFLEPIPSLNYSSADAACKTLGLVIASQDDVQKALNHGLETCKFGWIEEKVLLLPRIHAHPSCGKNGTGIVKWRNSLSATFNVFCFNASDTKTNSCDPTIYSTAVPTSLTSKMLQSTRTSSLTSLVSMIMTTSTTLTSGRVMSVTSLVSTVRSSSSSTSTFSSSYQRKALLPAHEEEPKRRGLTLALFLVFGLLLLFGIILVYCFGRRCKKTDRKPEDQKNEAIETKVLNCNLAENGEVQNGKQEERPQENTESTE